MNIRNIFLLGVLLLTTSIRADTGLFLETGVSQHNTPEFLLWNQAPCYPAKFQMSDLYIRAGYEWPLSDSIGLRVSAFDLGKYKIDALATPEEHLLVQSSGTNWCGDHTCSTPDRYITSGRIYGIGVTGIARTKYFFIESGLGLYAQSFSMDAFAIDGNNHSQYNGGATSYRDTNYGPGFILGTGFQANRFTTGVYWFHHEKPSIFAGGEFPSGVQDTYVVSVGYNFKV